MNASAVIVRELRAESRRVANYWLRVLAAGVVILTFASVMLSENVGQQRLGIVLFAGMNQTLLLAIWVLVPLMTADCISREKREGTLGLLFLTPLTLLDVISGKVAIHVVRALTLFLAALPLMGLPLVFGGVEWRSVLYAAGMQSCAVLLGIAGGIYASTRGGSTVQVMVMAEGFAWGLAYVVASAAPRLAMLLPFNPRQPQWVAGYVGIRILLSAGLFIVMLKASVRRLRATWQQESAEAEQPRWVKLFSKSDFWQAFFRWNKSRTLNRNPVAWLQEYSWTARLTKWGWFVIALVVEFVVLTRQSPYRHHLWQPLLTVALGLGVAFSAAGSFRREQETGLLELLLVTPLSERHLLRGRFWGLCCHYLPALAALSVGWFGDRLLDPKHFDGGFVAAMFPNPLWFMTMMVLGLYLSLGRLNFFLAWFLTWIAGFVLPVLATVGLRRNAGMSLPSALGVASGIAVGLAILSWVRLYQKLHQREFVVGKSEQPLVV